MLNWIEWSYRKDCERVKVYSFCILETFINCHSMSSYKMASRVVNSIMFFSSENVTQPKEFGDIPFSPKLKKRVFLRIWGLESNKKSLYEERHSREIERDLMRNSPSEEFESVRFQEQLEVQECQKRCIGNSWWAFFFIQYSMEWKHLSNSEKGRSLKKIVLYSKTIGGKLSWKEIVCKKNGAKFKHCKHACIPPFWPTWSYLTSFLKISICENHNWTTSSSKSRIRTLYQ